jgi:hypothetical protein
MGALLAKLPYNRGPRQDPATIIGQLAGAAPTPSASQGRP